MNKAEGINQNLWVLVNRFPSLSQISLGNDLTYAGNDPNRAEQLINWATTDPFAPDQVSWFWRPCVKDENEKPKTWHLFPKRDCLKLEHAYLSFNEPQKSSLSSTSSSSLSSSTTTTSKAPVTVQGVISSPSSSSNTSSKAPLTVQGVVSTPNNSSSTSSSSIPVVSATPFYNSNPNTTSSSTYTPSAPYIPSTPPITTSNSSPSVPQRSRVNSPESTSSLVPVHGGRQVVNLETMKLSSLYWEESETYEVRRGQWYFRCSKGFLVPYSHEESEAIENVYTNPEKWGSHFSLPNSPYQILISGYISIYQTKPLSIRSYKQVVRGLSPSERILTQKVIGDYDDEISEEVEVEHLLFVVHGIGANRDWDSGLGAKGDSTLIMVAIVDQLRKLVNEELTRKGKKKGSVELLPINWHKHVHEENDKRLEKITLQKGSRPLREFANDAIVDILYYMLPNQCQIIMNAVAASMNSIYHEFQRHNPAWKGRASIVSHSLGTIISFDLLANQPSSTPPPAYARNPGIQYPVLEFCPENLFLLGSPVGLFLSTRGGHLSDEIVFPTCKRYFNIFHPLDPVAYRIEPLLDGRWCKVDPVEISCSGGQRVHLMLRDTVKKIMNFGAKRGSLFSFGAQPQQQNVVDENQGSDETFAQIANDFQNRKGKSVRRIDYQLQERLVENVGDVLFAISSHTCYWTSPDVAAFVVSNLDE
eukprot:c21043_g1_i2.p1 GENE.c21043_g1_i2~~c21043_g1_i2.p1  ORF type:complete len:702 (+),score=274.53 c21043_g1_i2:53-2158(+)